ncbi:MFS multidrug transporter [Colletotrichum higginsianum]|nr:MFS multidrug transporter [Colletotrichum higginsianum]
MGPLYTALVLLPTLWIASHLRSLYNNYRAALLTGLPIIICPFDPESFIIAIFSVPARPLLKRVLPARAFAAVELTIFGWEFRDKAAVHARVGPAFVVVTTGLNQLMCADPAMAHAILARRREFVQPAISIKVMSFLGMNILTSNGESWSRQRRIVAPALNERISPDVWRETAEQATFLVDLLLSPPSSPCSCSSSDPSPPHTPGTSDTIPGLRSVAINVLTRIAYGHRKPFALPSLPRDPRAPMSYVDAISLVTQLLVPSAFVPVWLLRLPVMPRLLRILGAALARMPALTADMLDQERRRAAEQQQQQQQDTTATGGNHAPDTIMSMLVRLSDQEKKSQAAAASASGDKKTAAATANKTYLTEDEIAGNLFIFTAAGFDTTANTLAYAVTLLAAHPEWQAWIRAEIDAVLGPPGTQDDDDGKEELPDYATAFPKLTRCLAVMYETLRLFPPLTHLMRSNETTQTMFYHSTTDTSSSSSPSSFTLRAPCAIYINTVALHTSPSTWGPDALTFNPARWLQPSVSGDNDSEAPQQQQQQHLMTPPRGAFLPWSGGPRVCPGQKMSQVEFVTVIATLFRRCAAEPVPREGESMSQARQRLLDLTQDSQPILTLQMNRPQDVRLRWSKR